MVKERMKMRRMVGKREDEERGREERDRARAKLDKKRGKQGTEYLGGIEKAWQKKKEKRGGTIARKRKGHSGFEKFALGGGELPNYS